MDEKKKSVFSLSENKEKVINTMEYCGQLCYLENYLRNMFYPVSLKSEEEKNKFQDALEELKNSISKLWSITVENRTGINFEEGFKNAKNNVVSGFICPTIF